MENKTQRVYGIDLLKALCMLMVVVLHILGHGGVLRNTAFATGTYFVGWGIEIFCYPAVNCFAICTGYLLCQKKIEYKKLFSLWQIVFFYVALILVLAIAFMPEKVTSKDFLSLFVVSSNAYWYFTAYVVVFLLAPFFNMLIEKMSKEDFKRLLILGFVIFSALNIFGVELDVFKTNNGYSPLWLIYLYFLGAGVKSHGFFTSIKKRTSALLFLLSTAATYLIKIAASYFYNNGTLAQKSASRLEEFVSYISPFVLLSARFLVLFFLKLNVNKTGQKLLKLISPLVFQVYIIHNNPFITKKFLYNAFENLGGASGIKTAAVTLFSAAIIFLFCIIIDYLRSLLFKAVKIEKLNDKLFKKIRR